MTDIKNLEKALWSAVDKELLEKFGANSKANCLQAEQNIDENQSIINLRDDLLPNLMKGEININLQLKILWQ